jgi:hypothetical protein
MVGRGFQPKNRGYQWQGYVRLYGSSLRKTLKIVMLIPEQQVFRNYHDEKTYSPVFFSRI